MSIHPSLRGVDTLRGQRSVLTRFERIQKLSKDGKLDQEGDSAWGLPKVRTKFRVLGKKAKGAETDESKDGEAAATEEKSEG